MFDLSKKNIEIVSGGNRCACCTGWGHGSWFAEVVGVPWSMGDCYNHCCVNNRDRAAAYGWTANDAMEAPYQTSQC